MHGGDLFIVLIVAIVMIASVMKAGIKHGARGPLFHYHNETDPQTKAETMRLQEEVAQLKERIKVLERIAVEKENSLEKQIEELRDR